MPPAEGIRKLGFRSWYERELIEGHVYLAACVLSMVVVALCLEQIDWRHPSQDLAALAWMLAGMIVCAVALRRYVLIFGRAQTLVGQSICGSCETYGVLQVVESGIGRDADGGADNPWLVVRCRKCGHEWRMEN